MAPPNPDNNDDKDNEISAAMATLKIPPFWSNRPDLWFLQVETQFRLKGITASQTKYDYLVSCLPSETMEIVADILTKPPATEKYEGLKKSLLDRCTETEEKRLDSLLNKVDLGDIKPSELYRQMKSLAGDNKLINEDLLKKLWRNRLPQSIQALVIAIESTHTEEQIFAVADKVHIATDHPRISAIRTETSNFYDELPTLIKKMCESIERLEAQTTRNSRSNDRPQGSRDRSNSRNRSKSRNRNFNASGKHCWYHFRYGIKAEKCIQPCDFKNSSAPSDQKN